MNDKEYYRLTAEAERIGTDHGKAAASWVFDGNTTAETYRWYLRGIEEGDPEVLDSLREPNLSGEFAGDYTPRDLAGDLGIDDTGADSADVLSEFEDAYLGAASSSFWHEIERVCRLMLADDSTSKGG